jgi:hypothetical protein
MLFMGLDADSLGIVGTTWRLGINPEGDNPQQIKGGLFLNEIFTEDTKKPHYTLIKGEWVKQ